MHKARGDTPNTSSTFHTHTHTHRETLTSIGCTLPKKPEPKAEPTPAPKEEKKEEEKKEEPVEEEEPILDPEFPADAGKDDECIPEDDAAALYAAVEAKEVVEEADADKAMELRGEAVGVMQEGEFEKAVGLFTDALKLNPNMAPIWAFRSQCYLKWKKPNCAIRDATAAIALNPNQAKALRVRGQAYRKIGQWIEAADDLNKANQVDFDPDQAELLKTVQAKAKKIRDYNVAVARVAEERRIRELKKKQDVLRKQREEEIRKEREEAEEAMAGMGGKGGFPFGGKGGGKGGKGGMPGGMPDMDDPEIQAMMSDPDVMVC